MAALAQIPPGCTEVCGVSCVKPVAIPDRWDDITPIPGYAGGGTNIPDWRNNGLWNGEAFTDLNGNGLYDAGEPFVDGNHNGKYDAEAFDPLTTGYVADGASGNPLSPSGDAAREITIAPGDLMPAAPGVAYAYIDLPPANKGTPITGSNAFLANMAGCNPAVVEPRDRIQLEPGSQLGPANQGMRDLVAQDPNAYWDPITQSVQGSAFAVSPRVLIVAAFDPRGPISSGRQFLQVTKLIPAFMEQMVGNASVLVRLLRISTSGSVCTGGSAGDFLFECAAPATRASWGQIKATYR
jgi:hypothetical protein